MEKTTDDIAALEKRIMQLKKTHQTAPKSQRTALPHSVARAFRTGTEFVAAVFVGICMGFALDKFFGTKVIFILVFSVFGCMAGMVSVYRSAKEMEKEIERDRD